MIPLLGCVPYLNARPLLEGLHFPIREMVPAKLGEAYQNGEFDAALLSSIDVLSLPEKSVVDGVSIASKGNVYSVILSYDGDLKSLTKVKLDPASHTSNALLQIILGEFFGLQPEFVLASEETPMIEKKGEGRLLIGDPAIAFKKSTSPTLHLLDLGGEWFRQTGLPFVFALWALRSDFAEKSALSTTLREAKRLGIAYLEKIAQRTADPNFTLHYLSECIRYDLGEKEKRGLQLFAGYLLKYQLIKSLGEPVSYF